MKCSLKRRTFSVRPRFPRGPLPDRRDLWPRLLCVGCIAALAAEPHMIWPIHEKATVLQWFQAPGRRADERAPNRACKQHLVYALSGTKSAMREKCHGKPEYSMMTGPITDTSTRPRLTLANANPGKLQLVRRSSAQRRWARQLTFSYNLTKE